MKHFTLFLAATLLASSASRTEEPARVRYDNLTGPMSLTVVHDIEVQESKPVARRDFAFDLALSANSSAAEVTVTIDRAMAESDLIAHGVKERLGTRHLTGGSFPLSVDEDGRRLTEKGPASELTRTVRWTFDATDGRLLSLSLEQETEGVTVLPQGEMPILQRTSVELSSL